MLDHDNRLASHSYDPGERNSGGPGGSLASAPFPASARLALARTAEGSIVPPVSTRLPAVGTSIWAFRAIVIMMLLGIASQFAWPLASLPYHVSWNNNEGWNAYWSARALAGAPLYTGPDSPLSNNYPPLSFYIVGEAGRLLGDPILAGRLICLASLLVVAWLIERVIARFDGDRAWGLAAAGAFILIIAAYAPRYLVADDPQWLAHVPMVASLLLLVGRTPRLPSARRLMAACLLMIGSGLIKHNQIALPLATTAWLAWHDRRRFALWIGTAALVGGAAAVLLGALYGRPLFDQVLNHQRIVDGTRLTMALHSLAYQLPAALLAIALAYRRPRDPRLTLLLLFAAIAPVIGVFERLGAGVSHNAHFDSAIAFTIVAGILLSRGLAGFDGRWRRIAALALVIAPATVRATVHAPANIRQAMAMPQTARQWGEAIDLVRRQPGPVTCERVALCYWSGKPYALDMFNYGQKLEKGHDPVRLRAAIARRRFGAIVQTRDEDYDDRNRVLPADVLRLIEANYRVAAVLPDDLYVLVPAR